METPKVRVVDTLYEVRKTTSHSEAIVHHLLPAVESMRADFAAAVTAICTHLLLASRDMTSLIERVDALPVDDGQRSSRRSSGGGR